MQVSAIEAFSPVKVDWRKLTAKEIIQHKEQGEEVPGEYLQWAQQFLSQIGSADDETTYEKAESMSQTDRDGASDSKGGFFSKMASVAKNVGGEVKGLFSKDDSSNQEAEDASATTNAPVSAAAEAQTGSDDNSEGDDPDKKGFFQNLGGKIKNGKNKVVGVAQNIGAKAKEEFEEGKEGASGFINKVGNKVKNSKVVNNAGNGVKNLFHKNKDINPDVGKIDVSDEEVNQSEIPEEGDSQEAQKTDEEKSKEQAAQATAAAGGSATALQSAQNIGKSDGDGEIKRLEPPKLGSVNEIEAMEKEMKETNERLKAQQEAAKAAAKAARRQKLKGLNPFANLNNLQSTITALNANVQSQMSGASAIGPMVMGLAKGAAVSAAASLFKAGEDAH